MSNKPNPCDISGCEEVWCIPCSVCGNNGLWRCARHAKAHELSDHDPELVKYQQVMEKKLGATYGRGTCHTCEEVKDKVYLMGDAKPMESPRIHKNEVHTELTLAGINIYQQCIVCAYQRYQEIQIYNAQVMLGGVPKEPPLVPSPLALWDNNTSIVEFSLN